MYRALFEAPLGRALIPSSECTFLGLGRRFFITPSGSLHIPLTGPSRSADRCSTVLRSGSGGQNHFVVLDFFFFFPSDLGFRFSSTACRIWINLPSFTGSSVLCTPHGALWSLSQSHFCLPVIKKQIIHSFLFSRTLSFRVKM